MFTVFFMQKHIPVQDEILHDFISAGRA